MATQIFAGLMQLLFVFRYFKLKVNYPLLAQFAVFILLFTGLNYLLINHMRAGFSKIFITALAGLLLLIVSGTIRPREILRLMKSEN